VGVALVLVLVDAGGRSASRWAPKSPAVVQPAFATAIGIAGIAAAMSETATAAS
jgi:hypothetical protein